MRPLALGIVLVAQAISMIPGGPHAFLEVDGGEPTLRVELVSVQQLAGNGS